MAFILAMTIGAAPAREPEVVSSEDGRAANLPVRWLAASCGLPSNEPLPRLASALLAQPGQAEFIAHIAHWARNPDPGSNFARNVGRLANVPNWEIATTLKERGYDGLIYFDRKGLAGHCFFQRRENALHVFSVWVADRRRDGKLMALVGFDFIAYASAQPGIVRARLGTGSRAADRVLAPLVAVSAGLHWRVRRGGWVDFSQDEP